MTPHQQQLAIDELRQNPHHPRAAIDTIESKTGKRISIEILHRIANKFGMSWKRMRGTVRDRREDTAFSLAKSELKELAQMTQSKEANLWFFDEAAFSLHPSIPYAWQQIGETIEIPFRRGTSYSAVGFVDLDNQFFSYEIEGTVNSEIAIYVMDQFAAMVTGTNVVVLDNSPVHRSKAFQNRIADWASQGVVLYFVPPYSPELNLIEMIWREIKYRWLPLKAYRSAESLWDELGKVLAGIGERFYLDLPPLALS